MSDWLKDSFSPTPPKAKPKAKPKPVKKGANSSEISRTQASRDEKLAGDLYKKR